MEARWENDDPVGERCGAGRALVDCYGRLTVRYACLTAYPTGCSRREGLLALRKLFISKGLKNLSRVFSF